jgi:hypothetical protein
LTVDASDKSLEPGDPFAFTAVSYPVEDQEEADRAMARCFIEEFALMGWPADRIRRLFGTGFFAGTHGILERRGEAFVDALVAETFGVAPAGGNDRTGGVVP